METIFHISEKLQIKISRDAHSSCHFLLNILKGTAITLPEVILYYSTLSGTNRQILTPKSYGEHPRHFYRGAPLPGSVVRNLLVIMGCAICESFISIPFLWLGLHLVFRENAKILGENN